MSNAVTALKGAQAKGLITIKDSGLTGMITLRGDLASKAVATAVKATVGTVIPKQGKIEMGTKGTTAWMSPDELLLICDYTHADDLVAKLSKSLGKTHHLAVNVSDARAMFDLSGKPLRDVLAKGTPADMSKDIFKSGDIRRTRLGQLPVAIWLTGANSARLVCFRSVGEHVFTWLETAAKPGSEVGFNV